MHNLLFLNHIYKKQISYQPSGRNILRENFIFKKYEYRIILYCLRRTPDIVPTFFSVPI